MSREEIQSLMTRAKRSLRSAGNLLEDGDHEAQRGLRAATKATRVATFHSGDSRGRQRHIAERSGDAIFNQGAHRAGTR